MPKSDILFSFSYICTTITQNNSNNLNTTPNILFFSPSHLLSSSFTPLLLSFCRQLKFSQQITILLIPFWRNLLGGYFMDIYNSRFFGCPADTGGGGSTRNGHTWTRGEGGQNWPKNSGHPLWMAPKPKKFLIMC